MGSFITLGSLRHHMMIFCDSMPIEVVDDDDDQDSDKRERPIIKVSPLCNRLASSSHGSASASFPSNHPRGILV